VSVDADIARRMAAQFDISSEVEQVAYLVEIAVQPRQADTRRLVTLHRAFADLTEQLACGQDFDHELSVLGACVLEWKESRLAEIARCCCPLDPLTDASLASGTFESRPVVPIQECPVHGEGVS
jgi:hypothetical protein